MKDSQHPSSAQGKTEVKRFVAPTMAKALKLVSDEMGPEAIILSSQRTSEGVEVITSKELDLPTRGIDVRREFGQNFDEELDQPMQSDSAWKMQAGINQAAAKYKAENLTEDMPSQARARSSQDLAQQIEKARENMLAAKKRESLAQAQSSPNERVNAQRHSSMSAASLDDEHVSLSAVHSVPPITQAPKQEDEQLDMLKQELADMRLLLEQQLWHMNETSQSKIQSQIKLPVGYGVIPEHLKRLGLSEAIIDAVLQNQKPNLRPNEAWKTSLTKLAKMLPVFDRDFIKTGGVYAFVGPTGVGKTTTIAKLAAQYVMQHGLGKVAIVTTDTYRVGAHDQLRNLGRILNVPVKAVDNENSLMVLLAKLKKFPFVLIDTAGFRQGDPLLKQQLNQLDSCPFVKRILVMACNSQYQSMRASTHGYAGVRGIDACVISKLDESFSMGEALSVLVEKSLPVAYTTDGQEIPNDIDKATCSSLIAKAVSITKSASANLSNKQPQSKDVSWI